MRDHLRALRLVAAYTFRADPKRATLGALLALAIQAFDLSGAVLLALLTGAASRGDEGGVLAIAVVLAVTFWADATAHWATTSVGMTLRERATLYFDTRMATLAAGIFTLEPHERPEYLDHLEVLNRNHQQLAAAQDSIVAFLATAFRLVGTLVLLGSVHPLLLLLPAFGLPSLWATARSERWRQASQDRLAYRRRLDLRLFQAATSREAGKEIRVFGLQDGLLARFDDAVDEADRLEDAIERRVTLARTAGWLSFGAGFVAALLLVAALAADGRADEAQVVLVIVLAGQVNWGVQGLAGTISWLVQNLTTGRRLVWLEDFAAGARARSTPADPAPVPAALSDGIRFEGVTFRYPGSDEGDAVVDVDLHLPAGATIAFVGENGAGKSTLVKLLCRFYDPTAGRITVDGVDLRRFPIAEWRARLSAGFQDFAQLELVAREAVGVGDLDRLQDAVSIAAALDRAHAADVVDGLPSGLDTQLGRSFEGGQELSTGQWQKLALGRAMMREAPLLLLLDEPTACLDAPSEHALFVRYAGAARRTAAATGAITILVSHRFSTVRMADLIAVLHGGRVVEVGTHAELMAAGGLYAELYGLQAAAYRA